MKSIISGAVMATAIVACLALNIQAKPFNNVPVIAASDTGKMANDKMKMDKMKMDKMKGKKMDKMGKHKMKMTKKKMAKDSSGKM